MLPIQYDFSTNAVYFASFKITKNSIILYFTSLEVKESTKIFKNYAIICFMESLVKTLYYISSKKTSQNYYLTTVPCRYFIRE